MKGNRLSRQYGLSLIEILVVLVILASILMYGLRLYRQVEVDQDLAQLKANVDILFDGMRSYYRANCIANRSYTTGNVINPSVGLLDPSVNPPSSNIVPVNISTDLATPGYLTKWPLNYSPIALNYAAQFNLYNDATTYPQNVRRVNFCSTYQDCSNPTSLLTKSTNNVYQMTAQIAVQVNTAQAQYYKGRLNADCISSLSGSTVTPCAQSPAALDYLVFERLPSFATPQSSSALWLLNVGLKQFREQYTNDNDYAVTADDPTYFKGYQNYLCGGQ